MVSPVLFSSQTDEWSTPQDLFDRLHAEFGFALDVCATADNAKCVKHYDKAQNGLVQPWFPGPVWCNPPYGRGIGKWVTKAYGEATKGAVVVCLLPARTDTQWMHRYILPFAGLNSDPKKYGWAAGIIDGEGCIFIRKQEPTETSRQRSTIYDLGVKVTMTDRHAVSRMHEIFKVGHITTEIRPGYKTAYSWVCRSQEAYHVLQAVYPLLITKQLEAFYALEFALLPDGRHGRKRVPPELLVRRQHYYELLRSLKKHGQGSKALSVECRFLRGRLKFGEARNSAPFPSMVVIFG